MKPIIKALVAASIAFVCAGLYIGVIKRVDAQARYERDYARDLQVLVADRAILAARALGEPGARDLTSAEVADARERCARRPEYAELCGQIEERLRSSR